MWTITRIRFQVQYSNILIGNRNERMLVRSSVKIAHTIKSHNKIVPKQWTCKRGYLLRFYLLKRNSLTVQKGPLFQSSVTLSHLLGLAGFGGGESGASRTDSEECEARTPADSLPPSPVNSDNSFGVRGISATRKKITLIRVFQSIHYFSLCRPFIWYFERYTKGLHPLTLLQYSIKIIVTLVVR